MSLPRSRELDAVFATAESFSGEQELGTAHLLLALCTLEVPASLPLSDLNLDPDHLRSCVSTCGTDSRDVMNRVRRLMNRTASGYEVTDYNLMLAILRVECCQACKILKEMGVDLISLRTSVVSSVRTNAPSHGFGAEYEEPPTYVVAQSPSSTSRARRSTAGSSMERHRQFQPSRSIAPDYGYKNDFEQRRSTLGMHPILDELEEASFSNELPSFDNYFDYDTPSFEEDFFGESYADIGSSSNIDDRTMELFGVDEYSTNYEIVASETLHPSEAHINSFVDLLPQSCDFTRSQTTTSGRVPPPPPKGPASMPRIPNYLADASASVIDTNQPEARTLQPNSPTTTNESSRSTFKGLELPDNFETFSQSISGETARKQKPRLPKKIDDIAENLELDLDSVPDEAEIEEPQRDQSLAEEETIVSKVEDEDTAGTDHAAPKTDDFKLKICRRTNREQPKNAVETTKDLAERLLGGLNPKLRKEDVAAIVDSAAESDGPLEAAFASLTGHDKKVEEDIIAAPTKLQKRAFNENKNLKGLDRKVIRLAESYKLDPDQYPTLAKWGRNITYQAALGLIDDAIGRESEITRLMDILGKRRSNNPVLLGEAGVGKTAIVEGLAHCFVEYAKSGHRMGRRVIIELVPGDLVSGTNIRGTFSEKFASIKNEVRKANGEIIIFLDELHSFKGVGGGADGTDATAELKTALARGEFPCIGASTPKEFQEFIENDPAFERRFEIVDVHEPDVETCIEILKGVRPHYEEHHNVSYEDSALEAAVKLSQRFMHSRRLPDKAIGLLDTAGSRAVRCGDNHVSEELIATVVAELTNIPPERLTHADDQRLLTMEATIGEQLIGHDKIIKTVSQIVRRSHAGFRGEQPIGSMLFLGPTGVGKTELVKVLADFLFYKRDAFCRFDMSEFSEAHSVARLIGSPPGYVGHEAGGQLTEAIRQRPYQIILFDEVEKAHPDVLNIFLQILDEGRLTDGRGRLVNCQNCIVVMTSNLGAEVYVNDAKPSGPPRIGFALNGHDNPEKLAEKVKDKARKALSPELWNRIEEKLVFTPLNEKQVCEIAELQLSKTAEKLYNMGKITLEYDDTLIPFLLKNGGFVPEYGARPMRNTIKRHIQDNLAELILRGLATEGDRIMVKIIEVDGKEKVRAEIEHCGS